MYGKHILSLSLSLSLSLTDSLHTLTYALMMLSLLWWFYQHKNCMTSYKHNNNGAIHEENEL